MTVNGSIFPLLMHVHDGTAQSRFHGRGEKGAALTPQSHWSWCDEPQSTSWAPRPPLAPKAQPRGRAAVPWCATALCTWYRYKFIFAVSQHREIMSFPQFQGWEAKKGKGS